MSRSIVVIGGGPAGYVAALRAAQLGGRVTLVEREELGGVCLNAGCIPTKALLQSAEVLQVVRQAARYGVRAGEPAIDWPAMQARKREIVSRLVGGVRMLLERADVNVVRGQAHFVGPRELAVQGPAGEQALSAERLLVATGSRPMRLPIAGVDLPGVLDSSGALALEAVPSSLLVVGGGAVGLEFATLFAALGAQVTVVEMLPRLAPLADQDVGEALRTALVRQGAQVLVSTRITGLEKGAEGLLARVQGPAGEAQIACEKVLLAAGRQPNVEGLGLEAAGVDYDRRGIRVDERMVTSAGHILAAGDVVGGLMLAHVGMHQGMVAAENALGQEAQMRYNAVPSCIFTRPEAAGVGLSEAAAREQGYDVQVGRFPFNGNGKAVAQGEAEGFVKVVAEGHYGMVLGLHIIGPHASGLILEGALAIGLEATLDDVVAAVHPHPTLGEAVAEAAMAAMGRALHVPQGVKPGGGTA